MAQLTFSADPPHLLTGAGTADAQTGRPRMYAGGDGYGWSDTPPVPAGGFGEGAVGHWNPSPSSLSYNVLGTSGDEIDWGDGSPAGVVGSAANHDYAPGTYTVVVTTSDGAPRASWVLKTSDDAASPNLATFSPEPITTAVDTTVTVVGTNLPGSVVAISTFFGEAWLASWVSVDAAGGQFVLPVAAINAGQSNGQLLVSARRPDGVQGGMSALDIALT